jgi:hypothetical protein
VIVFVDESGLSQRPHRCRTWAPRGQTPVLQYHFNWKTLSAMAGVTWWNFYFRLFPGSIRSPQVVQFLKSPGSSRLQAVGSLGRIPHASKPFGLGLCPGTERTTLARISSRLRPGIKSGRVSLVTLETTRTAKLLPANLLAVEPLCPQGSSPHASTNYPGHWLLGTSGTILVTILCDPQ